LKILIFEYATAVGFDDPALLCEGRAILEGLLDDCQNLEYSEVDLNHEIYYLIASNFLNKEYLLKWPALNHIILETDLKSWIDQNISSFDACIFVAAEENMELYQLSCLIEDKGVKILGSSSEAVMICADKFKTYNSLKGNVPLITTNKLLLNDFKDSNELSNDLIGKYGAFFDSGLKMVVKPADGVACQGIKIVESLNELKDAVNAIDSALPYALLQDYIEGESCSVSLLSNGELAVPLSLNRQKIDFSDSGLEYGGGEVPWEHPLSDRAMEVAKKAVESISGLKGFVGVDLILSDQVHLVEINSRLTTPYVALRRLTEFNLVKAIVEASEGRIPINELNSIGFNGNTFKDKIIFKKRDNVLYIKFKD
jgi:predicted ATP-grasp superfamily ATP-dependent carboligase